MTTNPNPAATAQIVETVRPNVTWTGCVANGAINGRRRRAPDDHAGTIVSAAAPR
jgi:hypothetical protein